MQFFHFTEMPYPYVPPEVEEQHGGLKYFMPNKYFDPLKAHDLYQRYFDEYELADELGFNVMVNEHHQSAATLHVSASLSAATVIQRTRNGRVLVLGTPVPHHPSPVRIAEEMAFLDNISGGRVNCGFVRGVQGETYPSNANPARNLDMFFEAHDLIQEAWRQRDIFSWEGEFYHYRYVSIWPRPFQQPVPPVWVSGTAERLVRWTAEQEHTLCNLLGAYDDAANTFRLYRRTAADAGLGEPGPDKFAYLALCHVAETEEKAREIGEKLMFYLRAGRMRLGAAIPPGYSSASDAVAAMRGTMGAVRRKSFEELIEAGIALVGTPDQVVAQIERLYAKTGVGNIVLMNQAGEMTSNEVRDSIMLFAREVMPRVQHLGVNWGDDDTSWRIANDTAPIAPVLASAVS
ncbi:LLM class flavin-dependent oxidoreductase [Microbacterium pseudoresistens]|uniref:Alkanesulfonate monooxygenase SsuD/methylene tetrahydromethanopterin reductase-like flavin-dependent oxidoreductase (Luciferase family) n=1 Tax=Microbacterium pseudoresistens TaxID=640634 RepID=A0A7Y9EU28_9MICO|nr:LLM class flavin-dependent oxidoreductase [Microbacterium pseudoresistens]NYD53987.1 alkanesulfonate monooxygenase SsuD/methylene tetrahydromethanopterin reductase-like flavin-dependent oxidoreductase (luciferase family) [Microbacterium pseudoresistens]